MIDRSMIDVASGGALMDKTLVVARQMISNMASNTQRFGIRGASQSRMVNEIDTMDNLRLENQLTKMTSLVRQLAIGQHQPSIAARVCGICTSVEHPTDMCPTLQEIELSTTDSTILDITIPATATTENASSRKFTISGGPDEQTMSSNNMQFQQSTNATIQDLKMQIGELANTVNQL
ncbi:hypothetical protein CR513_04634, partial [Mucuna pruriens]